MSQQFSLRDAIERSRERIAALPTGGSPPVRAPSPRALAVSFASAIPPLDLSAAGRGVGVSGEFFSGGVAGTCQAFTMTPELVTDLCLGVVSGGVKFCILGKAACSIVSHQKKKVSVQLGHLYVAASRQHAWSHHHVDTATFASDRLRAWLSQVHSIDEWVRMFHSIESVGVVDEETVEAVAARTMVQLPLGITPRKRMRRYDEDVDEEDVMEQGPASLQLTPLSAMGDEDDQVSRLLAQWDQFVRAVTKLDAEVVSFKQRVGTDVDLLELKMQGIEASLGVDPGISDTPVASVWDGVALVNANVTEVAEALSVERSRVRATDKMVAELRDTLSDKAADWGGFQSEASTLFQVLDQEQRALAQRAGDTEDSAKSAQGIATVMRQEMAQLRDQIETAQRSWNFTSAGGNLAAGGNVQAELRSLSEKFRLLEARVASIPVTVCGRTFLSLPDMVSYVSNHIPTNLYYLFHDAVSLLESITDAFVAREHVWDEMYKGQKIGLSSESEARMVASFRITLPTVFGQVKEGTTSKHHLPAVKTYAAWNSNDNASGAKYYIISGLDDKRISLMFDFDTLLEGFPTAKSLASDLHFAAHSFVTEMCSWVDAFYLELISTADASPEEAWELLSACVKKIFEELRRPRASAANAASERDGPSKCAKYLWAIIQAHQVMKSFTDQRFRNHPSIAPVINVHVFKTRVTKALFDKLAARMKVLETKANQLDSFNNRLRSVERKCGLVKDGGGKAGGGGADGSQG